MNQINKYKHVVTRSVSGDLEHSKIDIHTIDSIAKEDVFFICSDGVHNFFEGIQIQQLLNTSDTLTVVIDKIEQRLKVDAKDNFSLVAVKFSTNKL